MTRLDQNTARLRLAHRNSARLRRERDEARAERDEARAERDAARANLVVLAARLADAQGGEPR